MSEKSKSFGALSDRQKDIVAGLFLGGSSDSSFFNSLLTNRGLIELEEDGTTVVLRARDVKAVLARRKKIEGAVEMEK